MLPSLSKILIVVLYVSWAPRLFPHSLADPSHSQFWIIVALFKVTPLFNFSWVVVSEFVVMPTKEPVVLTVPVAVTSISWPKQVALLSVNSLQLDETLGILLSTDW